MCFIDDIGRDIGNFFGGFCHCLTNNPVVKFTGDVANVAREAFEAMANHHPPELHYEIDSGWIAAIHGGCTVDHIKGIRERAFTLKYGQEIWDQERLRILDRQWENSSDWKSIRETLKSGSDIDKLDQTQLRRLFDFLRSKEEEIRNRSLACYQPPYLENIPILNALDLCESLRNKMEK